MIDFVALEQAVAMVFTVETLFWMVVGVTVGVGVGAIPGLSSTSGIALILPLTFTMSTAPALGLIIGLYKGAIYGGAISAIAFATPGTPDSAPTVYDGYKMMKQGKGRKAMLMALYASVTADVASDIATIIIAPLVAIVALSFGPSERVWLMMIAIVLIGSLSGSHFAKGLLSAGIGLFVGTIGNDPISNAERNTFGLWWLQGGVGLVPLIIGLFAMAAMLEEWAKHIATKSTDESQAEAVKGMFGKSQEGLTFKEYLSCWREMGIGFGVGTFVGMLPGLGALVASFLSYSIAVRYSPEKKIGTGRLEGIAASEAGNNATVGPTLISLLAFGIPGSTTAALIGGALIMQGATPSARMFEVFPEIIYALFIILLIANFVNLGIGRIFSFLYARLGQLPRKILVPTIMLMSVIGTYAYQQNVYDVLVMLFFGFLGFAMLFFRIPVAPLIITFVVVPMAEADFRRALLINRGDWTNALLGSGLAIFLASIVVVLLYFSIRGKMNARLNKIKEDVSKME